MDMDKLINDLTGREVFLLEELAGAPLHRIEEASQIKLMYALVFLMKKRESAGVKWNDVQDMRITEVTEYLGVSEDDEDTNFTN